MSFVAISFLLVFAFGLFGIFLASLWGGVCGISLQLTAPNPIFQQLCKSIQHDPGWAWFQNDDEVPHHWQNWSLKLAFRFSGPACIFWDGRIISSLNKQEISTLRELVLQRDTHTFVENRGLLLEATAASFQKKIDRQEKKLLAGQK